MTVDDTRRQTHVRPSRRLVVTGAAWSVPTVVAGGQAPAFAASPCSIPGAGTVSFATTGGNYVRTNNTSGVATVNMSVGTPLTVTFGSVVSAGYTLATNNLQAGAASPFPGNLGLLQTRTDSNASSTRGQTLTITFGRPVFNLSLPLTSFSWPSSSTSYQDAAWVSPAPTNAANGSNVTGTGTPADPFRNPATGDNPPVPYSGPTTTTVLTYSGGSAGITSVTVHYFDRLSGSGHSNQGMAILNMSFEAKPVGCP